MSNARKLQTEIDRVLKKVDEGVELFDEIWEKVYSAEQQNQKEKYEMDLKKEIKKLQRLRDQIKTWIGSSEVKDKDALLEARKLIETKMEQFKICEKETKTKTYSKEGLARGERLDPAEEAKLRTTSWIAEYVEKFQEVLAEKEFEIEKLSIGKGKKQNKHQIESLQAQIANHKFHLSKLEGIIRLVNNDRLECDPVDALKEDLDYYLESCEDEDYRMAYDEDFFYESLGLEELDVVNVDRVTQASSVTSRKSDESSEDSSKDKKSNKKAALSSVIPITIGRARTKAEKKSDKEDAERAAATPTKIAIAGRSSSTASISSGGPMQQQPAPVPTPLVPLRPAPQSAAPVLQGASMAAILKRETEQQEKERQQLKQQEQLRLQQAQIKQQEALRQQQEALRLQQQAQESLLRQQQEEANRQQQQAAAQQKAHQEAAAKQQAAQMQAQQEAAAVAEQKAAHSLQSQQLQSQSVPRNSTLDILTSGMGRLGLAVPDARNVSDSASSNNHAGSAAVAAPVDQASAGYLLALNESFMTAPGSFDNDRNRQYSPQNPYPTPSSYPSSQSAIFDNPSVFEKLGTDCLFFIFYYAQGTYQQYLAARELKKQSWRFHKKYMTWFQRHEEPKITTDEYEQGTYVYFDYETGWCTRIKTDFRFEYSYLEDSLQ